MAVQVVIEYLKKKYPNCTIEDVSTGKKSRAHKGYDIVIHYERKLLKIEVKGSTKKRGIPDAFQTEFDQNRKLIADFLYIVRFDGSAHEIYALSKEVIDSYSHNIVYHIKLSSSLITELFNHPEKYRVG